MRRIPSQVPSAVSRLLQASVLPTPPTWYIPVLSHPPPQLPPHQIISRPRANDPSLRPGQFTDVAPVPEGELERRDRIRRYKQRKNRPLKVSYEEDRVRRQFFKDFAFEALRPVSLVEGSEIDQSVRVDGEEWTSLEQRGAYPTVEDCISFVINLRKTREMPLSEAYAIATKEFVALRARHELATLAAEVEARHYGAEFKPDAFEREFNLEEKSLESLIPADTRISESTNIKYRKQPRYKWSNTISSSSIPSGEFSGGQSYVEKWRLPEPVQVEGGQQSAGDLLSAIPPPGAETTQGEAGAEAEDDLAFLQSVLGKSRA